MIDPVVTNKVANFFQHFKHQTFRKGEVLIKADENPPGVFFLVRGVVKECAISKKGEERVVNVFKPLSFFPMSWAINQTPNSYYYEATEELELWMAPPEEAVNFIKHNPDVLYDLMRRVFIGVDGVLMRMVYLMSGEAYTRVIAELLINAKRFGRGSFGRSIRLAASEKSLASQAGMARETVNREVKILKNKGLLGADKNILIIHDIAALEAELTG